MDQRHIVDRLLMNSRRFGCTYENGLSNHLPMALIALQRIGATNDQIDRFYADYTKILEIPEADGVRVTTSSWRDHLGEHRHNLAYRDFFQSELEANGTAETLKRYLPELIAGVSGGAFHPLIRLAYGIEADQTWEIAESLASWCMAHQTLGPCQTLSPQGAPSSEERDMTPVALIAGADLKENLAVLAQLVKSKPVKIEADTVFSAFKCVSESEAFKAYMSNVRLKQPSLDEIARVVIELYLSTQDSFTALHCVTATHALRIVSRYHASSQCLNYLWQAVVATYVITKCVPLHPIQVPANLPAWETIFERARSQSNDHVIKLVYSAHCEFRHYGSPLYHYAAAKKAGLLQNA